MKTIGLIGGMSWESTTEYYRIINEAIKEKLGGLHSAKIVLYSADMEEITLLQHEENWDELTDLMIDAAKRVERSGSDLLLICTNTMHKMAEQVARSIAIPLLHIADATAERIVSLNLKRVALLGTRFTMEQDFYKGRLKDRYNLKVIIPNEADRQDVHNIIYQELCAGEIKSSSKEQLKATIRRLVSNGAQGIILGCTELPLLIKQDDSPVPVFDTTRIHAEAAVEYALEQ